MGTEYKFTRIIKTNAPLFVVLEAVQDALLPLGGSIKINDEKGIITVEDGKIGILGDFLFDCKAKIILSEKDDDKFKLICTITKNPSSLFWLFLIGGFCPGLWALWGLNVFYLIVDLGKEYQKRLNNVEDHL